MTLAFASRTGFWGAAGATAAETIGQVIMAADKALQDYEPEAFLLLGDTNSCLAAIAAKRRKIPIFHMEAGAACSTFAYRNKSAGSLTIRRIST